MSEGKFNWLDAIAMFLVVLVAYHGWNWWYVGNVDYTDRYEECLDWNQAQFPDHSMYEHWQMCDTIVTPNRETAK